MTDSPKAGRRTPQGAEARHPGQLSFADWRKVGARVWTATFRDQVPLIAAGVAFFGILALVPALSSLVALYGLLLDPADIEEVLASMAGVVPDEVFAIVEGQVRSLASAGSTTLGLASITALLFALWSTRAGVAALIQGLNIVYSEEDQRSLVMGGLVTIALTLVLLLLAILALLSVLVVPVVLSVLQPGGEGTGWLVAMVRWPILFVAVMLGIGVLYRYGPDRAAAKVRWISVGAATATVLWLLASWAFSIYVANFASYNETYGSLGAIVILLLWF